MVKDIMILLLLLFKTSIGFPQSNGLEIVNLSPGSSKFPEIHYKKDKKVEEKINTFLQLIELEHLPGIYQKNPFEKIQRGPENITGNSTSFYSWQQLEAIESILSLKIEGVAMGAYPQEFHVYHNFDLRTGNQIVLKNFFSEWGAIEIGKILNQEIKQRIERFISKIIKIKNENQSISNDAKERIEMQISLYRNCLQETDQTSLGYFQYYFTKEGIQFMRGECSSHVSKALDDLGEYDIFLSYQEMGNYLSDYGLGLINGDTENTSSVFQDGKVFKGLIGGKYPITLIIIEWYSGSSHITYWYNQIKIPISLNGNIENGHLS